LSENHTTANDASQLRAGPSLETPFQLVKHTSTPESSLIRVTTSVTTRQCARFCPCQCHARSSVRSPPWLKASIGQLLLTYHSLLRTTPCNYPPCRQTPRKTEFTYYFPCWLAQKALIISSESDLSGRGASISIAMPITIGDDHPVWDAVRSGNIVFVQQLFRRGFSPYVITISGVSLVMVRPFYFIGSPPMSRGDSGIRSIFCLLQDISTLLQSDAIISALLHNSSLTPYSR
jgi:hypothetical protein